MIVPGFRFSGVAAGLKRQGQLDLGLVVADAPCAAAAVLTTNLVKAAPVLLTSARARAGRAQAVVVNSGCANAATGKAGLAAARAVTAAVARALRVPEALVLPASTGVIGALLPADRIVGAIPALVGALRADGVEDFSRAILTTDSGPKLAVASGRLDRRPVTVLGVSKGAGMICPDMATTLSFIVTDAALAPGFLRAALRQATRDSFNAITVDGDMSTNDTIVVLASGRAGNAAIAADSPSAARFASMLGEVTGSLARQIVRDGEGATKMVDVVVTGAPTDAAARSVARKIAGSPLVKTALHGEDPNWGRILGAAGAAGVRFDPDRVVVKIEDVAIVRRGIAVGTAAEQKAKVVMKRPEYTMRVDLGAGAGCARVLTCNLTPEYVKINANYRS